MPIWGWGICVVAGLVIFVVGLVVGFFAGLFFSAALR